MTDKPDRDRLRQAEKALARAKHQVDEQLKVIHRLEAQGLDDAKAQRRLDELIEALEAAQQQHKAARGSG